jgi:hypothetical protein
MKKILVIVSALIVAAACGAPPTNESTPSANTNSAATPLAATMTEAVAIAKEKAIWDTIKAKDYEAFGNMLAEDQLEVMGESVNDKAGSIAGVKDFEPSEVTFSDWKFLSIDKDAFVVTYTVSMKGKYKGKDFPPETDRASSAWVNRNGKWLAAYHQECQVKPPMPPAKETAAKANPNSAAKTTPSPAAAPPAATTGPDAVANEKIVWDLFKSKNYDAFAALLAPDFLEVEPDKVYTKAEAVKGMSQFDASKYALSEWKAVKFDDDASLVTYVVKSPGAPIERHSTIWANRDGKWLAIIHHGGTSPMKPGAMAAPAASPSPKVAVSPAAKASPTMKPMKKM